MKSLYISFFVFILVTLIGCQQQPQQSFTDTDKEAIKKEVKELFAKQIEAINKKDVEAWASFFSKDEFNVAIAGPEVYPTRSAWVDTIKTYFSMREFQKMAPLKVEVTPLAANIALMTSQNTVVMKLKEGPTYSSKHVYTMIWKKEKEGWKILHSHESWVDELVK